jgi:ankyrin repeat protein
VTSLLLEKGADVNQAMNNGDTPLMFAASFGKEEVLKLLLHAGADKAMKNGAGKNALDWAREKNHRNVVKLLVRHNLGYDV